jgi:hypothetical protein
MAGVLVGMGGVGLAMGVSVGIGVGIAAGVWPGVSPAVEATVGGRGGRRRVGWRGGDGSLWVWRAGRRGRRGRGSRRRLLWHGHSQRSPGRRWSESRQGGAGGDRGRCYWNGGLEEGTGQCGQDQGDNCDQGG